MERMSALEARFQVGRQGSFLSCLPSLTALPKEAHLRPVDSGSVTHSCFSGVCEGLPPHRPPAPTAAGPQRRPRQLDAVPRRALRAALHPAPAAQPRWAYHEGRALLCQHLIGSRIKAGDNKINKTYAQTETNKVSKNLHCPSNSWYR